ncbi:membrane protein [Mycobacterium phage ScoobyDoobyDoo]|nr:membrane protein [Mycobacterium phage ScoobyDoobyDoo]
MTIDFKLRRYWITMIIAQVTGVLTGFFLFSGMAWDATMGILVVVFATDIGIILSLPLYLRSRAKKAAKAATAPPL